MKKYLSFGGGVNSVAMMLLLLDQKEEFEAIFVDHGTDWPETYEYFEMFQKWLKDHGHKLITVLEPDVEGYKNLYDYYWHHFMVPSFMYRICSDKFKVRIINKYVEKPAFMMIGFDTGEAKRAKISSTKSIENRFPLLENGISRDECKKIITNHGLPIPMKSGCFICPYQKNSQWIELRATHPDLFCQATKIEKRNMDMRKRLNHEFKILALKYARVIPAIMVLSLLEGRKIFTLSANKKSIPAIIQDDQQHLFEQDNYPPCQCGL
jgi:3'-phosphoadenosine 5'-phosphosulfate sulfotransferase (PAPS reductase)/FAD synthetase